MTHFKKLSFCSGGNLVTVELVYMQYNISDSQALFSCFVLILRMASLDTLFCGTANLALYVLSLFLNFMSQNQDFCTYKKECTLHEFTFMNIHDICRTIPGKREAVSLTPHWEKLFLDKEFMGKLF